MWDSRDLIGSTQSCEQATFHYVFPENISGWTWLAETAPRSPCLPLLIIRNSNFIRWQIVYQVFFSSKHNNYNVTLFRAGRGYRQRQGWIMIFLGWSLPRLGLSVNIKNYACHVVRKLCVHTKWMIPNIVYRANNIPSWCLPLDSI
jgi:hypothetical protein